MSNPLDLRQYSGFHTKTLDQRRQILNSTDPDSTNALDGVLEFQYADKMIENCVGTLAIPVGVCPYMVLNDNHYVVPMATEEPSVIAACSNISKLVAENGGFTATTTGNNMITQVQIRFQLPAPVVEPAVGPNPDSSAATTTATASTPQDQYTTCLALAHKAVGELLAQKAALIIEANEACPRMVARGGGVYDVEMRVIEPSQSQDFGPPLLSLYCQSNGANGSLFPLEPLSKEEFTIQMLPYIVIYFKVNVCDAMGANIVNTIAEQTAPKLLTRVEPVCQGNLIDGVAFVPITGLRILSNLCIDRITTATFTIPLEKLTWKGFSGLHVAQGMLHALQLANDDVFRAVTHNKGVMNGITAAAMASGQDTRAIEASIHAYASIKPGNYRPVTSYSLDMEKNVFMGKISVPIAVGTKGGALGQHPLFTWTLQQLKQPDSQTLAQILAAIGLAQNFAAMRALAIEGIQSGHMRLHARKTDGAAGH
jgi:hydroxymethylglutaryl-CoA reductase